MFKRPAIAAALFAFGSVLPANANLVSLATVPAASDSGITVSCCPCGPPPDVHSNHSIGYDEYAPYVACWGAGTQQPDPGAMQKLEFLIGTWSCIGGAIDKEPLHFTIRYAMKGAILQSWLQAPKGYVQSSSLTYDSKNDRYVDAAVANDGTWFVAYRTTSGDTQTSVDHATSDGKLGRLVVVRTGSASFTSTGYPGTSGGTPFFKATCRKS
jgi:hypothetical protein